MRTKAQDYLEKQLIPNELFIINDVEDCTSFRAPLGPNRVLRPPVLICMVYLKCGISS